MSKDPIKGKIEVVDAQSGQRVFSAKAKPVKGQKWGQFQHQYLFDFSETKRTGSYFIKAGETPLAVHIPPYALLGETPAGGLVDGPIYKTIHKNLIDLVLTEPDELAAFQNDFVVYHDDIGDYATNEPTMDGTADAILMMAIWVTNN